MYRAVAGINQQKERRKEKRNPVDVLKHFGNIYSRAWEIEPIYPTP
jgi:hypothetical protein